MLSHLMSPSPPLFTPPSLSHTHTPTSESLLSQHQVHSQAKTKIRVVCARAYHCLFMHNMLIRPTEDELANFGNPDFTILNAGAFPCNRYTSYMTSSSSVDIDLASKEMVGIVLKTLDPRTDFCILNLYYNFLACLCCVVLCCASL